VHKLIKLNKLRIYSSSKHVTVHMQQTVWQIVFIQTLLLK